MIESIEAKDYTSDRYTEIKKKETGKRKVGDASNNSKRVSTIHRLYL
jgi:hypothetical protein